MNQSWITALGIAAAILTTSSFVPQAYRTYKSRRADDFSWAYLIMFAAGITLWLIYGVLRKDVAVIGANAATLVLLFVIAGVKFSARKEHAHVR